MLNVLNFDSQTAHALVFVNRIEHRVRAEQSFPLIGLRVTLVNRRQRLDGQNGRVVYAGKDHGKFNLLAKPTTQVTGVLR